MGALAGDAVAGVEETSQFLDVEVEGFARGRHVRGRAAREA